MSAPLLIAPSIVGAATEAQRLVGQWGYFVVFFMVLAQCAGIPLPAVAVLLAADAAAHKGTLSLPEVIVVGSAAAIIGSTIGYVLGRVGGRPLMLRLAHLVHAKESRIDSMDHFFERHGGKTVFIGRWVVFVRLWGSIAAGVARMPWPRFMVWNVLGGILWVSSLSLLAYTLGSAVKTVADNLDLGAWILLPIIVAGFAIAELRQRRQRLQAADVPSDAHSDGEDA
jgi:membrane protein DedA with SNARE-associated domain